MNDDDARLKHEIDRAQRARDLLEDELLREAFEVLKDKVRREWEQSPARDVEGREKLWLTLKATNSVEGHLRSIMETGKLASVKLESKRTLAQRAKDVFGLGWES